MRINFRVGQGFDVHAFVTDPAVDDRKLILGGVDIPYERGLVGHSDADVLYHALCDALLGAAGLGDIGRHFPDHDMQYKNMDSARFVSHAVDLLRQHAWRVGNVDCTIIAQEPKMAPHIPQMQQHLSRLLEIDQDAVNIKATTTECLGFTGRKEGVAAQSTVLIYKD